ncbi:MAG: hypothetical protein NVS3B3_03290 [Aquirhabdus sp.]
MSNSNYKAVQNLLDIYHEGDLETKKLAIQALGRAGGVEATEILLKIYHECSPEEKHEVITAIGESGRLV